MKTTREEPREDGPLCGWQTAYGMPWSEYCAERKVPGKPYCAEHMQDLADLYPNDPALKRK